MSLAIRNDVRHQQLHTLSQKIYNIRPLSNRGLGIKAKKCLYEGVILLTPLYGAEAWGMRSAERRKVNVLEMKCSRSLVGVSRMDRVRNELRGA